MNPESLLMLAAALALGGVVLDLFAFVGGARRWALQGSHLAGGAALVCCGSALIAGRLLVSPVGWWYLATGAVLVTGMCSVLLAGEERFTARLAVLGGAGASLLCLCMLAARCDRVCAANLQSTALGSMIQATLIVTAAAALPALRVVGRVVGSKAGRAELRQQHAVLGPVAVTLLVCAGVVGAGAVFSPRSEQPSEPLVANVVNIEGKVLPVGERSGLKAPEVVAYDTEGRPASIVPGVVNIVVFGAAWCEQCSVQLDVLDLYRRSSTLPGSIRISYVETYAEPDRPGFYSNQKLEDAKRSGVQVLVDDAQRTVASALGADAAPSWMLIDQDGKVVRTGRGLLDGAELAQIVEQAVALLYQSRTPGTPSTAPNSTAPNSTAPNSTAPNSTAPNSTAVSKP